MLDKNLRPIHPRTLHNLAIAEMAGRRTAAHTEISRICGGDRSFTMSIPVNADDSDIVLSNALDDSERLEREVYRLRGQLKQIASDPNTPASVRDALHNILFGTGEELDQAAPADSEQPQFNKGMGYVPATGLAQLHSDSVLPREYSTPAGEYNINIYASDQDSARRAAEAFVQIGAS